MYPTYPTSNSRLIRIVRDLILESKPSPHQIGQIIVWRLLNSVFYCKSSSKKKFGLWYNYCKVLAMNKRDKFLRDWIHKVNRVARLKLSLKDYRVSWMIGFSMLSKKLRGWSKVLKIKCIKSKVKLMDYHVQGQISIKINSRYYHQE